MVFQAKPPLPLVPITLVVNNANTVAISAKVDVVHVVDKAADAVVLVAVLTSVAAKAIDAPVHAKAK